MRASYHLNTEFRPVLLLYVILLMIGALNSKAQELPALHVVAADSLWHYLKPEVKYQFTGDEENAIVNLARYFREKFVERFFYDHRTVEKRFEHYNEIYGNREEHKIRAQDHMDKYAGSTHWILPFEFLDGTNVDVYSFRHLSRQHKMIDIAFQYFYTEKDAKYVTYFTDQIKSLNTALTSGSYEKIEDGNGVYEAFRSGYRVLNWLSIHNMLLGERIYSDEDQLRTIATLMQHGEHLYQRNEKFKPGNHQTRGMSALAMLAILFRDFKGTDLWYDRAMSLLREHLDKEINDDGFQFERSVHYHMSDIVNYYYVYQLAKINEIVIDSHWENKLRSLFTTLVKIAYPDKTAPVLQDDTEIPWSSKNDISGTMTLGYLLFGDPQYGYFANDHVSDRMYWFLSQEQLDRLMDIKTERPGYGSIHFEETHYYIMREGWDEEDKMMIISAGLDKEKPDHQHGDMLGIQAIAFGNSILPNYQVRYSLEDLELFKNSLVKNVALIDNELQGKEWTSNKGGSGFGKFKQLPRPQTISWISNDAFDFYAGSHDGFEDSGVQYTRQVLYIKDDFWIVKDNFQSEEMHEYKQVWQGHYTVENGPNLIRSTFQNGSGCDIYQLRNIDDVVQDGARGKEWTVVTKSSQSDFEFITIVFPYKEYHKRIDESYKEPVLNYWQLNQEDWSVEGENAVSLSKGDEHYFFNTIELFNDGIKIKFSSPTDIYVNMSAKEVCLQSLGTSQIKVSITGKLHYESHINPGQRIVLKINE